MRAATTDAFEETIMAEPPPNSAVGKRESFWSPDMQDYCVAVFGPEDAVLRGIVTEAAAKGFPAIAVSPADGQLLRFLVTSIGAKRAVEIGTLGGYSGAWIARALGAGGRLDTFELSPERAAFAREHLAAAKSGAEIVVHEGPALDNLSRVTGKVDFVFIDADKQGYPQYLQWAADHLRAGGIVALDNAFAWGGVVDPKRLGDRSGDADAMRTALAMLASGPFTPAMIPSNEGLAVGIRKP
jgi:caffeoyl-CoA O-methyltransferase